MIRAFIALRPPEALRDRLEALADDLDEGRATPWENLHLTLAFLGENRPEALEDVAVELERLTEPRPTVTLRGVGIFGGGKPRSAHVLAQPDPALKALRDALRRACRRGGLELPHARFTPHVTLARFSTRAPAGERLAPWLGRHAGFSAAPFEAHEALLIRSELGPDGPVYHDLMEIPLAPAEAPPSPRAGRASPREA